MKFILFPQKNILSNNANSKLNGIYSIIGTDSNFLLNNTTINTNSINLLLNNSDFINYTNKHITFNALNNSNVTFNNGSYICNSLNNGSLILFPCPIYNYKSINEYEHINYINYIDKNDTVLFPSDSQIISKNIISDGIKSFFSLFSDAILYNDLSCTISDNSITNINNIKIYNKYYMYFPIQDFINALPKDMNSYNYIFLFKTCTAKLDNVIKFENFNGGNLILKFTEDFDKRIEFHNCKNIIISGVNSTNNIKFKYDKYFIFYFNNCFNVSINNIDFEILSIDYRYFNLKNIGVSGNVVSLETLLSLIVFKNCNVNMSNSTFYTSIASNISNKYRWN